LQINSITRELSHKEWGLHKKWYETIFIPSMLEKLYVS
jgi:hypothetical protein